MDNNQLQPFVLYTTQDSSINIEVFIKNETVWLNQKKMAELFNRDRTVVTKHLGNIFVEGELQEEAVCANIAHTAEDGKIYNTQYYNLDAIISVGYRANSKQAIEFRKWSTSVLRDYIIKGFAMDDELLKNGTRLGKDYFEELLERIRDIRSSERRFYQKITDIYATAVDYDGNSEISRTFFKTVQNKLHFAIHGKTAAELITERADSTQPRMGLMTSKGGPKKKIMKSDVAVGKNYLAEKEMSELNRIVTMYLDYAENQAQRGKPMTMEDHLKRLDAFLDFNEYEILDNPGKISMQSAKEFAEGEYQKFKPIQDKEFKSDFDKLVEKTKNLKE